MGLIHNSSQIVRDGLILHLDAANYKSWTTNVKNLISNNPVPISTSGHTAAGGTGTLTYDSVNQAVLWTRDSYEVWGAYLQNDTIFAQNLDTTKQYTASFEWYNQSDFSDSNFYWEIIRGDGINGATGAPLVGNSTDIGNGWKRFTFTFTPVNVGDNARFRVILYNVTTGVQDRRKIYFMWRKLQLEQNPTRTDFVDGSNPATFNNLVNFTQTVPNSNSRTYVPANGGSIWYRGDAAVNGFDIPSSIINLETLARTREFTVMFGVQKKYYGYSGNSTGNSIILTGSGGGYSEGWRIIETRTGTMGNAVTGAHQFAFGMPELAGGITITDSVANRPAIAAFSISPTTITGFINGSFSTSGTPAYGQGVGHLGQIGSSNYGVGAFAGNFSFMMIYNRTLTQAEITQNYNALRQRFGL